MRTHDQIVSAIQTRAKNRGLLSHYCKTSLHCWGSPGLPDIILAGLHGTAWLEVKAGHDNPKPAQTTWRHTLLAAGHECYVIREADLDSGLIDGLIARLAGPSPDEYSH